MQQDLERDGVGDLGYSFHQNDPYSGSMDARGWGEATTKTILCNWFLSSRFKLEARLLVAFSGYQQCRMKDEQRAKGKRFLEAATLHQPCLLP